jgi:hypothetical protein
MHDDDVPQQSALVVQACPSATHVEAHENAADPSTQIPEQQSPGWAQLVEGARQPPSPPPTAPWHR